MINKPDIEDRALETSIEAARAAFPGKYVDTMPDPEDEGLIYVRVFGVADDGTYPAQVKLADALAGIREEMQDTILVPFVVSLSDTAAFYPEFMPEPPADDVALPDPVFSAIKIQRGKQPCEFRSELQERGFGQPEWNPQLPSIVSDIDSIEEVSDARAIRFAA